MELQVIQHKIYEVRGLKIMLDFDLAELFDVETRILNQAVKRNRTWTTVVEKTIKKIRCKF